MPGYPDWQRYSNVVGSPLVPPQQIDVLAATQTFGPFPVSQWRSVLVTVNNGAHPLKLIVDTTPLNGLVAVQQTFVLKANGQTQFVILNRSDRIKFLLSSPLATAPSPDTIDWSVHPCNLDEGVHSTANPGGILAATINQNVNAGANFNVVSEFYFGPARVIVGNVTQATTVFWSTQDANNGNVSQNTYIMAANGTLTIDAFFPPLQNIFAIVNNGAAAETVSVTIMAIQP